MKCDICGNKIEPIYRNPGDLLEDFPYYDKVRVELQHKHGVGFYDYRLCQVCVLTVLEAIDNLEKQHKN